MIQLRTIPVLVFMFVAVTSKEQRLDSSAIAKNISPKNDTYKKQASIRFICMASAVSASEPILIINGKKFSDACPGQVFFNWNDVQSLQVINPKDDSIKYFGDGKEGVIIITTHHPIEWMTSEQIARRNRLHFAGNHKNILFIVDGKQFAFYEPLYFAPGQITKIAFKNNCNEFYDDRFYRNEIIISTRSVNK